MGKVDFPKNACIVSGKTDEVPSRNASRLCSDKGAKPTEGDLISLAFGQPASPEGKPFGTPTSTVNTGTTILYIGGSILVILAAVLLITKRRMNAED